MSDGGSFSPRNFEAMRRYRLDERKHLVSAEQFGDLVGPEASAADFFHSLPKILAGKELRNLVSAIVEACRAGRPVVFAMGAHVIKCGLSPLVIDMMERGLISAIALNGSGAVHDFEVAAIAKTSEDVGGQLQHGLFGFARETGDAYREAAQVGAESVGLGRAFGDLILRKKLPHRNLSILAAGARLGIPVTVHVALGTDIVHVHPGYDGAELGRSSYLDFQLLGAVVRELSGGVWLNIGSSVILPEIFLKLLSAAANEGRSPANLTTANLDMIRHYRPMQNVVTRPPGDGICLIGHHEILIPLLRIGILTAIEGEKE